MQQQRNNQERANFAAGFKRGVEHASQFVSCETQNGNTGFSSGYRFGYEAGLVSNATDSDQPDNAAIQAAYESWAASKAKSIDPQVLNIASSVVQHKLQTGAAFPKTNKLDFIASLLQRKVR